MSAALDAWNFGDQESRRDVLDRAVDEAYLIDGKHGAVARVARKYGLPAVQLYRRARQRAIVKPNRRARWSEAEDQLLEDNPHLTGCQTVELLRRRGFPSRSRDAVWLRRRVIGATYDQRVDSYTAEDVAALMGVSQNTVSRWCRSGLIEARRRNDAGEHREHWIIERHAVRRFMIEHPLRWRAGRCDQLWLIDVLVRRRDGKAYAPGTDQQP